MFCFFFVLLGCKYVFWIYITVLFWNVLIYLMPIYYCFYISCFCFTNWKQIKGTKTSCLSNVRQNMHQQFYNSCYSLHLCFVVSALGDDFAKKKVIFISLYLLICNILCFIMCRIWSDVLWSFLVKWFYSESFQIMTNDKRSHKVIICHFAASL